MESYTITQEFVDHADDMWKTGGYRSRSNIDLEFIEFFFRDKYGAKLVPGLKQIDFILNGEAYEAKHLLYKYPLRNHQWQKGYIKYYTFFAIKDPVKGRVFKAGDVVEFELLGRKTYDEITDLIYNNHIYKKDIV